MFYKELQKKEKEGHFPLVIAPVAWKHIPQCFVFFASCPCISLQGARPVQPAPTPVTDAVGVCVRGSEVSRRCLRVGLASTFPSYWPVSLLPQRDSVTGTNLFGVLEKTRRSGDDTTGQSAEEGTMMSVRTCQSSLTACYRVLTSVIIDYMKPRP